MCVLHAGFNALSDDAAAALLTPMGMQPRMREVHLQYNRLGGAAAEAAAALVRQPSLTSLDLAANCLRASNIGARAPTRARAHAHRTCTCTCAGARQARSSLAVG